MLLKILHLVSESTLVSTDKFAETFTEHTPIHTHTQSYRCVLALYAGAVKAEGGNSLLHTLYCEYTLVPTLTRLWLGQVLGPKGDGFHHVHWNQDTIRWKQLRTFLQENNKLQGHKQTKKYPLTQVRNSLVFLLRVWAQQILKMGMGLFLASKSILTAP